MTDPKKSKTVELVQDPDDPEGLLLDLGTDLCDHIGWKVGDQIEWIDNKDGTWTLRKKTSSQ